MAYLFKYLSRQLINDLNSVFSYVFLISTISVYRWLILLFQHSKMCHLLGKDQHVRAHIRRYTAEAFAFLMRKARKEKLSDLINHILESLLENGTEEYIEGLSMLFFESMKVVAETNHVTCTSKINDHPVANWSSTSHQSRANLQWIVDTDPESWNASWSFT